MPDSFLRRSHSPASSIRSNSLTAGQPVIYCTTCSCSLSSSCIISGEHQNHKLRELDDAAQQRKDALVKSSSNLESKIKKFVKISERIEEEELRLEEVCERTREALTKEYSTLMALVEQNQQQAFRLLNAHKETMKQHLHQVYSDSQNYQQTSAILIKNIQELNSRRDSENLACLLDEISAMEISMATMNEFYSTLKDKVKLDHSRVKALKTSVKKIVEKNTELLPRPWEFSQKITLDSQTKQGNMQISEDNTEIWVAGCTPRGNGRTPSNKVSSEWGSVLAAQKFKKGQHYWEVNVAGCRNWVVGIVEHSGKEIRPKSLGHDKRSWVLECDDGEILAMHNDDFSDVKENDVQTLGVFLDCDKGRVKFYNVATGNILHHFIVNFKRPIVPTFSIQPDKKTARLKICNLSDEERTSYESDAESVSSQSQSRESPESFYSSSLEEHQNPAHFPKHNT